MNLEDADDLARDLMRVHGLMKLGWRFGFDRAKRRFGICWYWRKLIGLSRALVAVNTEKEVRDVILHEIAHALVGNEAGHGPIWKAKATEIGARPRRCYRDGQVVTVKLAFACRCSNPACAQHYLTWERMRFNGRLGCILCRKQLDWFRRLPGDKVQPWGGVRVVIKGPKRRPEWIGGPLGAVCGESVLLEAVPATAACGPIGNTIPERLGIPKPNPRQLKLF